MLKPLIQTMYDYSAWAHTIIFDTAASLTHEQYFMPLALGTSFPTIQETLVHTIGAQRHWLARFKKTPTPPFLQAGDFPDLNSIRAMWESVEAETQAFIAGLNEANAVEVIRYTTQAGKAFGYPLWQIMLHQVNHATQHRSEVASMLTYFGHSPGDVDAVIYFNTANLRASDEG